MSLDTFRHLVPFAELLSAVVGTIYFYKYKNTYLKYFLILLWYITLTEFSGWYVSANRIESFVYFDQNGTLYNLWMYNLLRIFTYSTIFYIYIKSINTKIYKQIIKAFLITYLILEMNLNHIVIKRSFLRKSTIILIMKDASRISQIVDTIKY